MAVLIAGAIFVAVIVLLFTFVEVCGTSMTPTFNDGDILIAVRILSSRSVKLGDIVVAKPPVYLDERFVIKRVVDIKEKSLVFLQGDNYDASFDSRDYGYVPISNVKYRVIKRIYLNKER